MVRSGWIATGIVAAVGLAVLAGVAPDERRGSGWAVPHGNHFWFAWVAFRPDTRIWRPGE